MKKIRLLALAAALVCGLLIFLYMKSLNKPAAASQEETAVKAVVTAAQDIPAYTVITEDMLTLTEYPEMLVSDKALLSTEEAVGLQSSRAVYAGEMLIRDALGSAEEVGASLSCRIPEGLRAMTVDIGLAPGVAGYLTEGDHVDVLVYEETDAAAGTDENGQPLPTTTPALGETSRILFEDVEVLTTGEANMVRDGSVIYSNLTFLLTPDQCRILTDAEMRPGCSLYLTLRSRTAEEEADA